MNSSQHSAFCDSDVPWWVSYSISVAIFIFGFIIIGMSNLFDFVTKYFKRKKKKKEAMKKRRTRLIISQIDFPTNNIYHSSVNNRSSFSSRLNFISFCEIMISKSTFTGRFLNIVKLVTQLLSWVIYVVFTFYQVNANYLIGDCFDTNGTVLQWADFALNIFCLFHFTLRAFAANDILKFWILPTTMIEISVIPNILVTSFLSVRRQGFSCLRIYYLREVCDTIAVSFGILKVNRKFEMAKVILYIISLWTIGGGLFHMFEGIGDFWATPFVTQQLSLWNSSFTMLVTISTVGYGDINPITVLGRALILFYIIYGITMFVTVLPNVISTIQNLKYKNRYISKGNERHIIVSGKFESFTIIAFLKAFKRESFKGSVRNVKIVTMNKDLYDENLLMYMKRFSNPIKYLIGSLTNHKDLKRVNIHRAKLSVILSMPFTNKINEDDIDNIMTAMILKSQRKNMRTIVQLHLYSNKVLLKMSPLWNQNQNDMILCIDELRLGLMAYNCLVPGIATLVINLITFTKYKPVSELWRKDYENGLKVLLYNVQFSDCFHGMSCLEVALIVYKLWDVCLLAIKCVKKSNDDYVLINPMVENIKIDSNSMIAIVMARDEASSNKLVFYCSKCSPRNPSEICHCYLQAIKNSPRGHQKSTVQFENEQINESFRSTYEFPVIDSKSEEIDIHNYTGLDRTGSFYWAPEPNFDDVCLDVETAESQSLSGHILVCLCGNGLGTIDLCNFMMPLRSQSLRNSELQTVVILGNKNYFKEEKWTNIKNFPMFLIIDGSPIQARDLRAAGLLKCHTCVIINGNDNTIGFSDKSAIICSILIRSMRKLHKLKIPIIIEIRKDEIAHHFSSMSSQNYDTKVSVQHTEPFARGIIFTNSAIYSCIYTVYKNPDTFSFIKTLLNGRYSDEIELMFGSGVGLLPQNTFSKNRENSNSIIKLFPIKQPPLNEISNFYEGTLDYAGLFEWALMEKRILCLGLYRLNFGRNRYVFTHPEKSTEIFSTDQVYGCVSSDFFNSL